MSKESNKRLAKNTVALYFRTFITLIISLYTTRVVLEVLGASDYGIYSVVAGVVILFSFLNGALSYATERFLTIQLGKENFDKMRQVFSMSMNTLFLLVLIFLLFSETLGLWFINSKLNIPTDRLWAANWAFQLSIVTFCITVLRTPYRATIISNEKMAFFAYVSIFEAITKLAIVYCLHLSMYDKLISYTALFLMATFLVNLIYIYYCKKSFVTCNYHFFWDKNLFINLTSFTGWNLLGNVTNLISQNGVVFLINIFYGVGLNAALGIAYQVNSAVTSFISGFQTSFVPQIVKLHSQGKVDELHKMINSTSKFSFMLIAVPVLILMFNMSIILNLWLDVVPEYTIEFCLWIVAGSLLDAITGPFYAGIMANGDIKRYQVAISLSFMLDFIFISSLLRLGVSPAWIFISRIFTRGLINMLIGLYYLRIQISFNIINYVKRVLAPIVTSLLFIIPIPLLISSNMDSWRQLIFSSFSIVIISLITYSKVLLTKGESLIVKTYLNKILKINNV
jgi:O-antigen/teichoic acid export membrane protein